MARIRVSRDALYQGQLYKVLKRTAEMDVDGPSDSPSRQGLLRQIEVIEQEAEPGLYGRLAEAVEADSDTTAESDVS